ncbi:thiol reductant ABC exporter subunit CydD [Phreatobacter stygius]|uniref:Thiol reductant ABC exporter subunit CydD n=1 Tax=Phreatobacter stygius TaxID=1940610 RepID=A0A4D7B5F9_9HYPH|nr:thiol reductant ABC exporter subunit CydD [Phreatobacter stygius]QCI69089.1 thiol reductant ABC exporter subunit CydD [Phreatobacter stygius]
MAAHRPGLRIGGWLQVAASLLWLPQAALIAQAVGRLADGGGVEAVVWPAALVLGLGLARAGIEAAGSRLAFRAARATLSDLRDRAVSALSAGSPLDSARPASGLAASVIAEQADTVTPYLARFQPARLRATVVPLVILAAVLPLSWTAALVLLIAAPLIPIFMALIGWRAKAASEAQMVELGGMNAFLLDRLRGLATIRGLGAVDLTARRLRANAEALRRRTMAVLRIAFLSSAVLELFAALGVAMVAVYIGFHLLGQLPFGAWGAKLDLAQGLFILLLAPAFFEPLRDVSAVWHDRAAGEAAIGALHRLSLHRLALPGAAGDVESAANPPATRPAGPPAVRIEGLGFRHAGAGAAVLEDFDLTVAAGERVALLGPSGSGKSTLLALVAGLAPAGSGRISIGDVALGPETSAALRRRMAWIGQRPHIFAGSIRTNIALGRPDVTPTDVAAALKVVALDKVASARSDAEIGEGGTGLSGGEILRLALARAAADGRTDLLLVDEPTAHLDGATAAEVTDGLIAVAAGRTLILATHDPVLAARMDRIIRLEARS